MNDRDLPPDLERAIEEGVADGSIFSENSRDLPRPDFGDTELDETKVFEVGTSPATPIYVPPRADDAVEASSHALNDRTVDATPAGEDEVYRYQGRTDIVSVSAADLVAGTVSADKMTVTGSGAPMTTPAANPSKVRVSDLVHFDDMSGNGCQAAMVTGVDQTGTVAALTIFPPHVQPHTMSGCVEGKGFGTWHWPERD